jgi:hypothetical protein
VTAKQIRTYQKKAARYVADSILDSLESFPENEQVVRLKRVHAALRSRSGGSAKVVAREDSLKLEQAAKSMTEIVLERMGTSAPERAKAMPEEIRPPAAKRHKK